MVTVQRWRSPVRAGSLDAPLMLPMETCDSESEHMFTGGDVVGEERVVLVGAAGYPRLSKTASSTVEG